MVAITSSVTESMTSIVSVESDGVHAPSMYSLSNVVMRPTLGGSPSRTDARRHAVPVVELPPGVQWVAPAPASTKLAAQPMAGGQASMTQQASNELMTRAYTFAVPGDTLQSLAARVVPEHADGRGQLLAWNPHLALRAPTMDEPGGLLPTDLVYTEPAAPA